MRQLFHTLLPVGMAVFRRMLLQNCSAICTMLGQLAILLAQAINEQLMPLHDAMFCEANPGQ